MKKWLTRWLAVGTGILVSFSLTSCSDLSADSSPAKTAQESHSTLPEPSATTVGPYTLVNQPVSIDRVDPPTPVTDGAPSLPVKFTDTTGKEIEITDTSRVLALDIYGTFAETIIALGEADKLVGRTSSNDQAELAHLPEVTVGGHQLSAEAILNIGPTLILADETLGPPEVMDQLADAGIPIVTLDSKRSLENLPETIRDIAQIMGVPERGEKLSQEREETLARIQEQIRVEEFSDDEPPNAVFLYIRGTAGVFFIFGQDSGADELITALGLNDVASQAGIVDYKPATAEALAQLEPDIIFVMSSGLESGGGLEGLLNRPGILQTPAGQSEMIVDLPDGQSLSFGPSYPEMVQHISQAIKEPVAAQ